MSKGVYFSSKMGDILLIYITSVVPKNNAFFKKTKHFTKYTYMCNCISSYNCKIWILTF